MASELSGPVAFAATDVGRIAGNATVVLTHIEDTLSIHRSEAITVIRIPKSDDLAASPLSRAKLLQLRDRPRLVGRRL